MLSVCEKNVSTFSCNSEVLQYQQIIHLIDIIISIYTKNNNYHYYFNNYAYNNKQFIYSWSLGID